MALNHWRALKGLVYVSLMGGVTYAGIINEQLYLPVAFIFAALLMFGIEIREIQIADFLSITFRKDSQTDKENKKE